MRLRNIVTTATALLGCLWCSGVAIGATEDADATRTKFERAAESLTFLSTGDIAFDRDASYPSMSQEELDSYNTAVRGVLRPESRSRAYRRSYSVDELTPLLKHKSAKVRTLALVALYHTEQPQAIMHFAKMLDDTVATFPHPQRIWAFLPGRQVKQETPMQSQIVAQVARKLLVAMLAPSQERHRLDPENREETLKRFWSLHRGRDHWIRWYEFRLKRATQGRNPIRQNRQWMIHAIIGEMDQLPPVEREVYRLAILGQPSRRRLGSENQLLYAARRLGPDRLLSLAADKPIIDDPDLPKYVRHIQGYVYAHAQELLRPKDADRVLEIARESKHIDAYIAAANLSPKRASTILHEGFDTQQGEFQGWERSKATIAMWRLVGEVEADFIVDWFFTDRTPDMGRAPYRADLAAVLLERFGANDRKLLARLIRDKRLDQTDLPTHRLIVRGLNRNLLHPVIAPQEERNTSHPLGDYHFDGMIDQARKQHPKETEALLSRLADWRRKLRASIRQWETP